MADAPEMQVFPRQPLQQRAKDRFERVLEDAEALLLEKGLSGFSIPELAARQRCSRATIYNFFPTPYTIFNELTRRYLLQLEEGLHHEAARLTQTSWQEGARAMVAYAGRFYNRHPVARILILGRPTTEESYRAQELMIQRLGQLVQRIFERRGVPLPAAPPDVPLVAVELGITCYRVSFFLYGKVTTEYLQEAGEVMIAYLSRYIPGKE
jgi:AcrR family transcriptional regulator